MNTDRLHYELVNSDIDNALISTLPYYGSGSELFEWLEQHGDDFELAGSKFEGWTHEDTIDYMLQHAGELGSETRVDANGTIYLVMADGTVQNLNGSEANVALDELTGRDGGDDTITGSKANDVIYGQEGNDSIFGDAVETLSATDVTIEALRSMDDSTRKAFADNVEGTEADGDDQLYGGTGDDLLFGMGGDDYLNGGAGEDYLFGGSGNDIIVYDQNDYMVSGGSGIDFMVSNSDLTIEELLAGGENKPIVDGIEVLITGDDATSLTNISQLAEQYGITLGKNDKGEDTLTLDMEQWTHNTTDNTYTYNGEGVDLTLQTTLAPENPSDRDAVQQQVFTLQHSNG